MQNCQRDFVLRVHSKYYLFRNIRPICVNECNKGGQCNLNVNLKKNNPFFAINVEWG